MDQNDTAALAMRLNTPSDSQIPGSDECRDRFLVALHVSNGKDVKEKRVECIYVGERGVMIVWKWTKIPGFDEETPDVFTLLPQSRQSLVRLEPGLYSMDIVVSLPEGVSADS